MKRKLQQIGKAFGLPWPFYSYEEIQNGIVNRTYKVNYITDDGTGMAVVIPYLIQRINTYAFRHPDELMSNIEKVTEHIRAKNLPSICFRHTDAGRTYLMEDDSFWRVYQYIPAVTFDKGESPEIVRKAGQAFGEFQLALTDFDAKQLFYTIPHFHDTRKRYETLLADAAADPCGRAAEAAPELAYLLSVQEQACRLTDLYRAGRLPLRVTHNDTKINNVLFDEMTREPLVVIDLDTVMPGLVGHDFGDAIRYAANFTEEDSEELDRTGLDLNVFWAFAEGFLSRMAASLTEEEIDSLALSCFALTCELATRFLADYLVGDKYFKINSERHNLIRARCQIALARDMQAKLPAMDAIVKSCVRQYREQPEPLHG